MQRTTGFRRPVLVRVHSLERTVCLGCAGIERVQRQRVEVYATRSMELKSDPILG